MTTTSPSSVGIGLAESTSDLNSFALFGKTAFALILLIIIILLCAWLIKKINSLQNKNTPMHIVGSIPIGSKERIIIVEIQDKWLILGITPQSINMLHELPATPQDTDLSKLTDNNNSFARKFLESLQTNVIHRKEPPL